MKFRKIKLSSLLKELTELPSDWKDETAHEVIQQIEVVMDDLRQLNKKPTKTNLQHYFKTNGIFLDICRLFLGKGQEPVAHTICDILGDQHMGWSRLRKYASEEPQRMAEVMVALGLPDIIQKHLNRQWKTEDILIERYKMSRGRAIAGQKRGRALEDEVEEVLKGISIPFETGVTFVGKKHERAKCDFAIPTKHHPKIVMEAKGFEATGSKLTDFLGDILKIGQAKEYHTYFFLITDGRGWHNRQSDLKKIVEYHQDGLIDMIYTISRLTKLAKDVKHIYEKE